MSETDEATTATDDALYVLTAALLTPAQYPSVLGNDYPEACDALGLSPASEGYGLVLGQDGAGARWTVVIDDVSLVAVAISSWDCGMTYDLSPDERSVVTVLGGWPLALAVQAPDVPAPHDPEPETSDEIVLAPVDTDSWGPAQRRLAADEIALQWSNWRSQVDLPGPQDDGDAAATEVAAPAEKEATGDDSGSPTGAEPDGPEAGADTGTAAGTESGAGTDTGTAPDATRQETGTEADATRAEDGSTSAGSTTAEETAEATTEDTPGGADDEAAVEAAPPSAPGRLSHPGLRRVLDEAHHYLAVQPPVGRVRSAFAGGKARTLRVDGPDWSMVARTDDIAFVLLDDEPGEVHVVGRGTGLPVLLSALDVIAIRPN